jgi:hypothetical protein
VKRLVITLLLTLTACSGSPESHLRAIEACRKDPVMIGYQYDPLFGVSCEHGTGVHYFKDEK